MKLTFYIKIRVVWAPEQYCVNGAWSISRLEVIEDE